jgi:hypothetical protein
MWSYIEETLKTTPKLLEPINEFSKVTHYKIHLQKSVAFSYTNNEVPEKNFTRIIHFTTALIEYLGVNLAEGILKLKGT